MQNIFWINHHAFREKMPIYSFHHRRPIAPFLGRWSPRRSQTKICGSSRNCDSSHKNIRQGISREAQLFVGWVSALRNPCGGWVSCFNPTYVHLIFNSTHLLNKERAYAIRLYQSHLMQCRGAKWSVS